MKIRALVIDDEPLAHEIVKKYASDIDFLEISGHCYDAMQAYDALDREQVDMLILDIRMPKLKGTDLLKSLPRAPLTVIASAYPEYALEGFELDVCDYLLKPFSFERFLQALMKVRRRLNDRVNPTTAEPVKPKAEPKSADADNCLFLKDGKKIVRLDVEEIDYLESYGNYVKVWHGGQMTMTPDTLTAFENRLGEKGFLRVHKSFLVPFHKIREIDGNRIFIRENEVPVGRAYRKVLEDRLG
ncbi:DNA-binding response regulator [Fulvitalea axinellae]|uniref:DNA-binding response regulator n=1 Tax=Fulvitalea axinellae TaxID=1182444 RepID=A0AAU9CUX8_9BACT|nr:DNA-binding response regulator [Fulvitalea axinellae]